MNINVADLSQDPCVDCSVWPLHLWGVCTSPPETARDLCGGRLLEERHWAVPEQFGVDRSSVYHALPPGGRWYGGSRVVVDEILERGWWMAGSFLVTRGNSLPEDFPAVVSFINVNKGCIPPCHGHPWPACGNWGMQTLLGRKTLVTKLWGTEKNPGTWEVGLLLRALSGELCCGDEHSRRDDML